FQVKAAEDGKSNVLVLTSITTPEEKTFEMPQQFQALGHHPELVNTQAFKKVKTTLQKRHQSRKIWIRLEENLDKIYVDEDGNMQFNNYFLEEITQEIKQKSQPGITEDILTKVLEKMSNKQPGNIRNETTKNLKKLAEKFVMDKFTNKGWSPRKYAISFKYINGPLLDYALKKERILLEINKNIDSTTLIDLIATCLPDFVTNKINRDDLDQTRDLFNELRSLEHLIKKNNSQKKKNQNINLKEKPQEKTPCEICEKIGKKNRYHPESSCWFKSNESNEKEKKYQ
ncbi:hypothetical protein PV325_013062, partial [Microctonus aethiopoides]